MRTIDNFLNGITMYRLLLWGLALLAFLAIIFGFLGVVSWGGWSLLVSFFVLLLVCYVFNLILAWLFKVPANVESSYITALILFFILTPPTDTSGVGVLVLTGLLAMASKYLVAIHRKHLFNPAAIALVIISIFGIGAGAWWVATAAMLPFILIFGFLVLRKARRFSLFFAFLVASLVSIFLTSVAHGMPASMLLSQLFVSWPIFFFGTIMLTEPLTTPPSRGLQVVYGLIVGVLFGLEFHVGPIYSTPALALVLGNIFSYAVGSKERLRLRLKEKHILSPNIYEFVFTSPDALKSQPGQYMEWTLGHKKPDLRGNRRFFTVASSPTEEYIRLGVRVDLKRSSSFKTALIDLEEGDEIFAGSLAGDFVLPKDASEKMVWIAGGIGVTPFRSMAKYLADKKEKRDVVLLYSNKTAEDIVFQDVFAEATAVANLKTIYALSDLSHVPQGWPGERGNITEEMIKKYAPDYMSRTFYISGPHGMVTAFENFLSSMGVRSSQIKTDFFPGFV